VFAPPVAAIGKWPGSPWQNQHFKFLAKLNSKKQTSYTALEAVNSQVFRSTITPFQGSHGAALERLL